MADDKLKYSDIILPDDSIEKLLDQLESLNSTYEKTVNAIRAGADKIVYALKNVSGATKEGRESIEKASSAAAKLKTAQESVATSYDKINSDLKEHISLWKSLSAEERAQVGLGQELKVEILSMKAALKGLDEQLKAQVPVLTEVEKAQKKLNYVRSDEYTQLLRIKKEIADVIADKKEELEVDKALVAATDKLRNAQSTNNIQLKELDILTKRANREAKLTAIINTTLEGSYDNLSAKYELAKMRLNAMGRAQREAGDEAENLEKEIKDLYSQMSILQKNTGKHTLDVGNYGKVWSGVGFSVQQVVRELPTLAQGSLIFFRAIANNIPILIDDIQRLRIENKAAIAQGKPTVSVIQQIVSSLFSWQTGIVVLLSLLSAHGDKVVDWVKNLIIGKKAVDSFVEAQKKIDEELKNTNASYGSNVVKLKDLQREWGNLTSETEKAKWLEKNKKEFNDLGIAIETVEDAEKALITQTPQILEAFKLRARAAAAKKLAEDKYLELLQKEREREKDIAAGVTEEDKKIVRAALKLADVGQATTSAIYGAPSTLPSYDPAKIATLESERFTARIKRRNQEIRAVEEEAEAFYKLASAADTSAESIISALGLEPTGKTKKDKTKKDKTKTAKERQTGSDADITERIYKFRLDVAKKFETSQTELELDEFEKRKKATQDKYNVETRALRDKQRLITKYLNDEEDRYEEVSDEEKRIAISTYEKINEVIVNYNVKLARDLEKIETEKQIKLLEIQNTGLNWRIEATRKGSEEEYALQVESLENQRQLALLRNKLLPANQRQSEADINAAFDSKQFTLGGQFSLNQFDQQQALAKAEFDVIEHNETEITKFKLNQEKERLQKQLELVEAGGLKWRKEQIDAAKYTIQGIDRELAELNDPIAQIAEKGLGVSLLESLGFNEKAIKGVEEFSSILIDNINAILEAEIEAAEKAIELAEQRVEAAQKAYDAEVEARNNGYANNVATAKKELEQEKKNQLQKQRILEDAQRRQQNLDSVVQASSLITASANLWSSFSKIPVVGPALALAAIATMWGSFAAAKIKARQVTAQTEEYGEGGLEFLEGGSHASGNDIDLGVNNKRRKRMHAEGGEALAIINRRSTRRYRKVLPDIIESLNKGLFEDKFMNAFSAGEKISLSINQNSNVDLSKIEDSVQAIRAQNETRYYTASDGAMIVIYKNVKRIIKN